MTFVVNHDIVWLHVPVDDMACVQGVECAQDLRTVEKHPVPPSLLLTQLQVVLINEHPVKILPWQILEHEVHIVFVDERLEEHHYKVQRFLVHILRVDIYSIFATFTPRVLLMILDYSRSILICPSTARIGRGCVARPLGGRAFRDPRTTAAGGRIFPRRALPQHVQDRLLVLNMLYPLRLVNGGLGHNLQREQLALVDDQVHGAELPIAYFHARIPIQELLLIVAV